MCCPSINSLTPRYQRFPNTFVHIFCTACARKREKEREGGRRASPTPKTKKERNKYFLNSVTILVSRFPDLLCDDLRLSHRANVNRVRRKYVRAASAVVLGNVGPFIPKRFARDEMKSPHLRKLYSKVVQLTLNTLYANEMSFWYYMSRNEWNLNES